MNLKKTAYQKLGAYLKEQRVKNGLTQQDISKALEYSSPQFVSNWERGIVVPPFQTAVKLTKILTIDPSELVKAYMEVTKATLHEELRMAEND